MKKHLETINKRWTINKIISKLNKPKKPRKTLDKNLKEKVFELYKLGYSINKIYKDLRELQHQ